MGIYPYSISACVHVVIDASLISVISEQQSKRPPSINLYISKNSAKTLKYIYAVESGANPEAGEVGIVEAFDGVFPFDYF